MDSRMLAALVLQENTEQLKRLLVEHDATTKGVTTFEAATWLELPETPSNTTRMGIILSRLGWTRYRSVGQSPSRDRLFPVGYKSANWKAMPPRSRGPNSH